MMLDSSQWRSQRGVWGVQTPSIMKGRFFYCLVIEQIQWLINTSRRRHDVFNIEACALFPKSLTSRTDHLFTLFLFCSVLHHCTSTFEVLEYICMRVSICVHYVTCLQIIIVLTCNRYQIRPRKILQN